MTNVILFLAILALLAYAIERNHRRQRPARVNGSSPHEDRDLTRITEDLRGLPPSEERRVRVPEPRGVELSRISRHAA
ncbi:hypothetical protein SAMN05421835_10931 [Amycolatopsis sacchari]|uniref:Uncharacterized protein n=1 Tax=Amycolatopsis sacchari TaxID=115433 RepID=A0A1I3UGS0_9PSEU|nr:hypothetical protein [Amycolatopsis sacchari]SFJ81903.1 hypothetical protein SAMN05421835_10931 [Amycolatopsis sacchari]